MIHPPSLARAAAGPIRVARPDTGAETPRVRRHDGRPVIRFVGPGTAGRVIARTDR